MSLTPSSPTEPDSPPPVQAPEPRPFPPITRPGSSPPGKLESGARRAKDAILLSHWHQPFGQFLVPPTEFYATLESAVERRQIPGLKRNRVGWSEGGLMTATREYLRVERGPHLFDVCAAPFGTGYFLSWWLAVRPRKLTLANIAGILISGVVLFFMIFTVVGAILQVVALFFLAQFVRSGAVELPETVEQFLLGLTIVIPLVEVYWRGATYYELDVALMFQEAVHAAVLETVDAQLSVKGMKPLTELERKPLMKDFFGK